MYMLMHNSGRGSDAVEAPPFVSSVGSASQYSWESASASVESIDSVHENRDSYDHANRMSSSSNSVPVNTPETLASVNAAQSLLDLSASLHEFQHIRDHIQDHDVESECNSYQGRPYIHSPVQYGGQVFIFPPNAQIEDDGTHISATRKFKTDVRRPNSGPYYSKSSHFDRRSFNSHYPVNEHNEGQLQRPMTTDGSKSHNTISHHSTSLGDEKIPVACESPVPQGQNHTRAISRAQSNRLYICDWHGCTQSCTSADSLEKHYYSHTRIKPFLCAQVGCTGAFASIQLLAYHSETNNHEMIVSRNKQRINQDALRMRRSQYTPGDLDCTWSGCGESFDSARSLSQHHQSHLRESLFQSVCTWEDCSRVFSHNYELTEHYSKHLEESELEYEKEEANQFQPDQA
ncbi:hypothetical protein SARC_11004 [Sphaeroforma arctica JP610]|uniref:C2H2-type domain-containing protein n=1 Tax=Sphaeroforma arctica JP610 TaxID=667725 RepID=A0A0L0FI84_9EUKA|nr:hypothetical protein SARC_11004 [Sphaeroforma arctica JP610]KNC76497.1 hypothetical protein SARC_11004 [Sphaeroforma arctica JP610]|eukprot:XP_014150399.1 hypothetical protein SARC_11004 [Sphaeroforma arctica JP610]